MRILRDEIVYDIYGFDEKGIWKVIVKICVNLNIYNDK